MQPGVGHPSWRDSAAWSGTGFNASYPATAVGDFLNLSNVARATAAGHVTLSFVLGAAEPIQLIALANHNLTAADTWRLRLFAGNNPDPTHFTPVADSGTIQVFPSPSGPVLRPDGKPRYVQTVPLVLVAPVSAQSGLIDITTASVLAEVGGVEIASWWNWRGISFGRELGINSAETEVVLAGGPSLYPSEFCAREMNGQLDASVLADAQIAMDFQQSVDITRPFVFVQDSGDPTTWPRGCMVCTHTQIPLLQGVAPRYDRWQFKFNEHYR